MRPATGPVVTRPRVRSRPPRSASAKDCPVVLALFWSVKMSERHLALDVILKQVVGQHGAAPGRAVQVGDIKARGFIDLLEVAAGGESLYLAVHGHRRAYDQPAWQLIIHADGAAQRGAGIVGEAWCAGDFRVEDAGAEPEISASRPAMLLGSFDLALDRGRAGPSALNGVFRQQGNLARRDEQAVFVVRLDGLARRGQMVAIDEQKGLLLGLGDIGIVGQDGGDR